MRVLLIALLVNIPTVLLSQSLIPDTLYFNDGAIKVVQYRNSATTGIATKTAVVDSAAAVRTTANGKQTTLVSGTNIKTVNGSSLLGSGDIAISGTAAWGSVTGTLSNQTDLQTALDAKLATAAAAATYLPKTTTSGVAASPTASGTVTVTHNLGRVPTIVRIQSISSFTSNAAATPVPFSYGTWNSTGNRCLYMVINGTTTQVSQTSTVFSIIMVTSAGNQITGVINNVTSTGFDITWSETGTHTAGNFLWECQ